MKEESHGKAYVLRIFQIILGITLVINSGLILTNPFHASKSLVLLLVITLIISGIERLGIGIIAHWIDKRSRITNIGLGIIAIILSIFAIVYPAVTISLVIMLMAFSLLIVGISRIILGFNNSSGKQLSRYMIIGTGIISVLTGGMIFGSTLFRLEVVSMILGTAVMINGIQSIISSISSR